MVGLQIVLFLVAWLPSVLVAGECSNYQPTRQPFFGELHLHTEYSADAATLQTRNTPRDAYRFAKGFPVGLPPFVDTRKDPSVNDPAAPPLNGVAQHPYCVPPDRCQFTATRIAQLPPGHRLDFAAITDHAEMIGETNTCWFEGGSACQSDADCTSPGEICGTQKQCVPKGYNSESCIIGREEVGRLQNGLAASLFAAFYVTPEFPKRFPFCNEPGSTVDNCLVQSKNVWQQIQAAAKEANEPCRFSSFVAYEYTSDPAMGACQTSDQSVAPESGKACWANEDCPASAPVCGSSQGGVANLHRNIIFRTDQVPAQPVTNMDAIVGCGAAQNCVDYTGPNGNYPAGTFSSQKGVALGSPQILLTTLNQECNASNNCEFLSIPHNPNFSGGAMFLLPGSDQDALVRKRFEPLVEMIQAKGSSECRYSPTATWGTTDELCSFESMDFGRLNGPYVAVPDAVNIQPNSFIRNALKTGLQYQRARGINPFQFGFVGATDNHNGTPSDTDASSFAKHGAHGVQSFAESGNALNETDQLGLESNAGGVTGVWAEENTRNSLFAALKRRETFATSGTRATIRMFGGFGLPANLCSLPDAAKQGYAKGVPMGGTLSRPAKSNVPSFMVMGNMDPGWTGHPGTPLERIQIIKGWVDANGQTQETVYDVAGEHSSADVSLRTCGARQANAGHSSLCSVWKDPSFNPNQSAFYYARVLEIPSCRWNQYYCNAKGVNCSVKSTAGSTNATYTEWEYQQCCSTEVPKSTQQRAWGSPIWYTP